MSCRAAPRRRWSRGIASLVISAAAFWDVSALAEPAKAPARRPNVLLIIADDLAPRIGAYGDIVRSPNIDRLARDGVTFDRAYTQFPLCGPSRASFLTGVRPQTTQVTNLDSHFRKALPDIRTLPEYFRRHGYFAGRVGKVFHQSVPADIGSDGLDDPQSWDEAINPRGRDRDAERGRLKVMTPGIAYGSAMSWLDDGGTDDEQTDGKVAGEAIRMMERHRGDPFFIAVGFYRPHVPMVAPARYFDLYDPRSIEIASPDPIPAPAYTRAWAPDNFGMSADEQKQMIRAYHAATSFVDVQVGLVLEAVDRLGLADDTIVVFTSDHGYHLGEHGQWMKTTLWEEATRVPLIIRVPGLQTKGMRSPRMVEMVDLYPTLTELAQLPHYDRNEGRSLVPLLRDPQAKWVGIAQSQVVGGRSVRSERWTYIEWEGGHLGAQLFDHRADPHEWHDLAANPALARVVARMKARLPRGAVEARPPPKSYDPLRNCMNVRVANAKRPGSRIDRDDETAGRVACAAFGE